MPKKSKTENDEILKKLKYINLDLENIPKELQTIKPIKYKTTRIYNKKQQYKQYRFIPIKDIQILISPTNRMDDLQEKYKKAIPLAKYLDNQNEENLIYYTTFLEMLQKVKLEEIKKIEEEQKKLAEKIPFKVKFEGNYLWQIYYSEESNQYFMLVTTEDTDYSTFFYLLKKKIENKSADTIFVPISNINYSKKYFTTEELEDIENYLWLFTKDWPLIYEVYDKQNKLSVQIVGETEVLENIKSPYKITLKTTVAGMQLYKLLKAMFILQTEVPNYYNFRTRIDKAGGIEFYYNDEKVEYPTLSVFIKEEFTEKEETKEKTKIKIMQSKKRLEELKQIIADQEVEYIEKEKQITTFLECKKSFFGKFKYYFKYNKKSGKNKIRKEKEIPQKIIKEEKEEEIKIEPIKLKKNYTIEELVEKSKELEEKEIELKNIIMDINAFKLKNKNMTKKIENATAFIQEIDKHKKSIFEFWKYSNKDEVSQLPEGEEEEVNIVKKITKTFNYKEDKEDFSIKLDKWQRKNLSKEELDSIYIVTTNLIDILNKIKTNNITPKEIENVLKELKKDEKSEKELSENEEFDIFGGLVDSNRKIRKIGNKRHRELKKDKYNILEISQKTNAIGFKLTLEKILENIKTALEKDIIDEEVPAYKAMCDEKIKRNTLQMLNMNPEEEINKLLEAETNKLYFYKINLTQGSHMVGVTNSILYDNQNKTLPIGMELSSNIIVDIGKLPLVLKKKSTFKIVKLEPNNDFSDVKIRTIYLLEYEANEEKRNAVKAKKQEISEDKSKKISKRKVTKK